MLSGSTEANFAKIWAKQHQQFLNPDFNPPPGSEMAPSPFQLALSAFYTKPTALST